MTAHSGDGAASKGSASQGSASQGSTSAEAATGAAPEPQLSYEEAREALADVVRQLEAGGATLEQSLGLWERGETLATICQQWLDGAQSRLDEAMSVRAADARAADSSE